MSARDVVVTGAGLLTSSGIGVDAGLAALLGETAPVLDYDRFAPFPVHPACEVDFGAQIPKKSDLRQMEPWQKLGVFAAGLALDDAGLKDDASLKSAMSLIVSAGGGERDFEVDGQILTGLREAENPGAYLNERLMSDVRPTLFLAQLSNLLAGNIAIVHGVTGASRTFMGEEQAGVDAVRVAHARIRAGQADIVLVGGSFNAERPDSLMLYEMGGMLWKRPFASVWDRPAQGGGFILGSGGAFLMLEARESAQRRGARFSARVDAVAADLTRRQPGAAARSLESLWSAVAPGPDALVVSGATGARERTFEERAALDRLAPGARILATQDAFGHLMEGQFPAGIALAAALIARGEAPEAVVTSVGHQRGEGLVRLSRADQGAE
ncbi:MAG: beta-ketoacyl-ACP synthase [Salinarimonadaceae bacterium]|nr:MAG: beta-ketoacyl-ACP synthase [Salinarimonadaceae bacterium]